MITGRINLNILPLDYYIFPAITLNHFTLKGASRNILKSKKDAQNLGDLHNFILKQKKLSLGTWITDAEDLPKTLVVFLVNMKINFY